MRNVYIIFQSRMTQKFLVGCLIAVLLIGLIFTLPISIAQSNVKTVITNLSTPYGLFVNAKGDLFISEFGGREGADGAIRMVPKGENEPIVLVSGLQNPYAVVVDKDGNIYFTEKTGTLKVLRPGASEPRILLRDSGRIYSLAIDGKGDLLIAMYGSPLGGGGAIMKLQNPAASDNPSMSTILSNAVFPVGIAVDDAGNIYFSEYGDPGSIKMITPSGSVKVVVEKARTVAGLAVDSVGSLYYVAVADNAVKMLSKNGVTRTVQSKINNPWALALAGNGILYVAEKTSGGSVLEIQVSNPSTINLELILSLTLLGLLVPLMVSWSRKRGAVAVRGSR